MKLEQLKQLAIHLDSYTAQDVDDLELVSTIEDVNELLLNFEDNDYSQWDGLRLALTCKHLLIKQNDLSGR